MEIELLTIGELCKDTAEYCATKLCREGSEMQAEFREGKSDTPVVVICVGEPVAWVASHEWRGQQTLEAFVAEDRRRCGLASIGAMVLLSTSYLNRKQPLAVFSPDCIPLARSLGFRDVYNYTRNGNDWILHLG